MKSKYIGKRFGRLVVVERDTSKKAPYYLCDCDCGTKGKSIFISNLTKGVTKSCGCLNKETSIARGANLINKRFGKLVVVDKKYKNDRVYWLCQCDCGNKVLVTTFDLTSGKKINCGCERRNGRNIIGKRFYRLVVISKTDKRAKNGDPYYLCRCDCGNTIEVISSNLKENGGTRSCGCYIKEGMHTSKDEDRIWHIQKGLYTKLKIRNRKLGFLDNNVISFNEFVAIINQPCAYCGMENSDTSFDDYKRNPEGEERYKSSVVYKHNGVDRVDSNKGYEIDNVVPCCKDCNRAKSDMTTIEFNEWWQRVYNHWGRKK